MNAQERFENIIERYNNAFNSYNGYNPFKIWFDNDWVWLRSKEEYTATKYRVSQFEKMTETLESYNLLKSDD